MEALLNADDDSGSDGEEVVVGVSAPASKSGAVAQMVTNAVTSLSGPWDPMTSADWDREKHSGASLIRIKG